MRPCICLVSEKQGDPSILFELYTTAINFLNWDIIFSLTTKLLDLFVWLVDLLGIFPCSQYCSKLSSSEELSLSYFLATRFAELCPCLHGHAKVQGISGGFNSDTLFLS